MVNAPGRTRLDLETYAALLEGFRAQRYDVVSFAAAEPEARHLVLRHDIDMAPRLAVEMARVEARLGVSASYFVLLRSRLYNPYSDENLAHLRELRALGHDVGLHFDASLYPADAESLDKAAGLECAILEQMLGDAITIVSFHRPVQGLQGLARRLAGRLHTYQPRFFKEMGYCSDSEGRWRYGHPLEHESVRASRALQLLTHPVWWVESEATAPTERLLALCARQSDAYVAAVAANCRPLAAHLERSRGQPRH